LNSTKCRRSGTFSIPSSICYYSPDASPVFWIGLPTYQPIRLQSINELRNVRSHAGEPLGKLSKGQRAARSDQNSQDIQLRQRKAQWAK